MWLPCLCYLDGLGISYKAQAVCGAADSLTDTLEVQLSHHDLYCCS